MTRGGRGESEKKHSQSAAVPTVLEVELSGPLGTDHRPSTRILSHHSTTGRAAFQKFGDSFHVAGLVR